MKEAALVLLVIVPFGVLTLLNVELATFRPGAMPTTTPVTIRLTVVPVVPVPTPTPVSVGLGQRIEALVNVAMSWLGVPYLWGGCGRKGVDCSCFVQNVLHVIGINAPRTTVEQIAWASPVARGALQAGDLVFFDNTCAGCGANPTHVGLFLGGGKMIDAGDPVQINDVFSGYYAAHNPRGGRPPGL